MDVFISVFGFSLLAASAVPAIAATPAEAAADWYEHAYAVSFVEGDPEFYARYYEPAVYFVDGATPNLVDHAGLEAIITQKYVEPWLKIGWTTSKLLSVDAVQLGSDSAMLTARWSIEGDKGSVITECKAPGWIYIVVNDKDSWRIISELEAPCAD